MELLRGNVDAAERVHAAHQVQGQVSSSRQVIHVSAGTAAEVQKVAQVAGVLSMVWKSTGAGAA